ncbi:response regulator [Bacteriovorax sp. Seq25_V]|uniref:response regulator n=1 Tax=Bacteriovorax sp. Seq25_V TaxID=1201288 RepID=UPI00038A4ACF|nr:response regulator [Bacteriovorax sp. Seq25_V]EQC44384.1 response regulator receiver domain protein [Bacteriovorax sp. Seq25_V]
MTKHHVLVVDDCEDVRFLLSLRLQNLGFEVLEAVDGHDALSIIEEDYDKEIEIILLDVMMPKISGPKLIQIIKERYEGRNIKIVCITAHYDEDIETDLRSIGVVDVIKKPIKGGVLDKRLRTIIGSAA